MGESEAPTPLHPGATIRVEGHKARAYLNGKPGTCIEEEEKTGKWVVDVQLTSKIEQLKIKPENLVVTAPAATWKPKVSEVPEAPPSEPCEEAKGPREDAADLVVTTKDASSEAAKAAAEPGGLESSFEYAGKVGLLVHRRPASMPRAPFAVVVVPGNPGLDLIHMGKFHSHDERLSQITAGLKKEAIPFVQFDYEGIFLSSPNGPTDDISQWKLPEGDATTRNPCEVFFWAKEHLHERLIICTWNFGFHACNWIYGTHDPAIHGVVAVSLAYNFWMPYKIQGLVELAEQQKQEIERCITDATWKSLYIVGNKDFAMTPLGHVRRLSKLRKDGGEGVTVHEIDQKQEKRSNDDYFNLVGHLEEVAETAVSWIKGLKADFEEPFQPTALGA